MTWVREWRFVLLILAFIIPLPTTGCIEITLLPTTVESTVGNGSAITEVDTATNSQSDSSGGDDTHTPYQEENAANPLAEQLVTLLPLPEEASGSELEISAMSWYGDHLILVPQYPERFDNQLFAFERQQILDTLDGKRSDPLNAIPVPFNSGLLRLRIPRFYQGFEAVTFVGDQIYLTVEAGQRKDEMASYLVSGSVEPDLSEIRIDYESYVEILAQADLSNQSDESLLASQGQLVTLYEANGVNINPNPVAHLFDLGLDPMGTIPFPNIEYRITDATSVDSDGRFWAINYYFPRDMDKLLVPDAEPLATRYGEGPSHAKLETVERLVEFQITDERIVLTERPPIQLTLFGAELQQLSRLIGAEISRNWEGIVRLDDRGFLLVTDKFPDTLLGFVPFP
ncbi:MAG: hypothetical protein AAF702_36060 [Chloroflexota bacterium]